MDGSDPIMVAVIFMNTLLRTGVGNANQVVEVDEETDRLWSEANRDGRTVDLRRACFRLGSYSIYATARRRI